MSKQIETAEMTHYANRVIAALRAKQPASTFMNLQCKDYFLCAYEHVSELGILSVHSVIHKHLSTFMSYFARLFPVSTQVSSHCISFLLFSLICTSHTLITVNVLDRFTPCSVCECVLLMLFASISLSLFVGFSQKLYILLLFLSHFANPYPVILLWDLYTSSLWVCASLSQHECYQISDLPHYMGRQVFYPNLWMKLSEEQKVSSFSLFWFASNLTNVILKTSVNIYCIYVYICKNTDMEKIIDTCGKTHKGH